MLGSWVVEKLESVSECPRIVLRDPLQLLTGEEARLDAFAKKHGFIVIPAPTNLILRQLMEVAATEHGASKLLLWDKAPLRRRRQRGSNQASPPFYPDFLELTPPEARIELDLREYLVQVTDDPLWPKDANDPHYARLISKHLEGVIRAHKNLRATRRGQFTDHDFHTIVAYAAFGVPEAAFKKLEGEPLWRIALLAHESLAELQSRSPEVARPILEDLRNSPAPFRWFADRDPETVLRAFYLSVIISQHSQDWKLLLANVDPQLGAFSGIEESVLKDAAPRLVRMDEAQADQDLTKVEEALDRDSLRLLLIDHIKIAEPEGFAAALEKERYSTLVRDLALMMALENALSDHPSVKHQKRVTAALFPERNATPSPTAFVDTRRSPVWPQLSEAYRLVMAIVPLRRSLMEWVKVLTVKKPEQLSFGFFWNEWNGKQINRLEYYLSALERLVTSGDLLPRPAGELPDAFVDAVSRIRERVHSISNDIQQLIDRVNSRFQEMVALRYPEWVQSDTEVYLTSQFLRRCLKPYWDAKNEKATLFIFDGMRYDIWEELVYPLLVDRVEKLADLPASSLLPSETQLTRKAISAGTFPDEFNSNAAEDALLKEGLSRELGLTVDIEVVPPEGAGTGETVRYRAGNLDVYIFELCDKELHGISWKTLPDGRVVPARPLSFIYQQHLKNIIDTEFMSIVRRLEPGTKLFITADHGFGRMGREQIWFDASDLNDASDCSYQNCYLRTPFSELQKPAHVKAKMVAFTPEQLRVPSSAGGVLTRSGEVITKEFRSIVFPKVGYAFKRSGSPFNPNAYSHGGISVQELMIPMVVLKVKPKDEGILAMEQIAGPDEMLEGDTVEFSVRLSRTAGATLFDELRVDLEASLGSERMAPMDSGEETSEPKALPKQVVYVTSQGAKATFRVLPDLMDASIEERRAGVMDRILTVTAQYRDGRRTYRKVRTHRFTVLLNSDVVVRRIGKSLGGLLGLTPKRLV